MFFDKDGNAADMTAILAKLKANPQKEHSTSESSRLYRLPKNLSKLGDNNSNNTGLKMGAMKEKTPVQKLQPDAKVELIKNIINQAVQAARNVMIHAPINTNQKVRFMSLINEKKILCSNQLNEFFGGDKTIDNTTVAEIQSADLFNHMLASHKGIKTKTMLENIQQLVTDFEINEETISLNLPKDYHTSTLAAVQQALQPIRERVLKPLLADFTKRYERNKSAIKQQQKEISSLIKAVDVAGKTIVAPDDFLYDVSGGPVSAMPVVDMHSSTSGIPKHTNAQKPPMNSPIDETRLMSAMSAADVNDVSHSSAGLTQPNPPQPKLQASTSVAPTSAHFKKASTEIPAKPRPTTAPPESTPQQGCRPQ